MRTEIKPKDLRNIIGLKDWEKETNILFNADAEQAEVNTTDYAIIKQLQAVAKKNKDTVKVYKLTPLNNSERIDSYTFVLPRSLVNIGGEILSKN